jgi:rhodanese-related sulfurtransferase
MPSNTQITAAQLSRLIGLPTAPVIIDVRSEEDFEAEPRLLPTAQHRDFRAVSTWASSFIGCRAVVACRAGLKLSEGVAAWLRHSGIEAESLEGGYEAWKAINGPLVRADKAHTRNEGGYTVWVRRRGCGQRSACLASEVLQGRLP